MKKDDFRNWLVNRIKTQSRLALGAAIAMGLMGSLAILFELWIAKLILQIGFVGSVAVAWAIALGIVGAVVAATALRLPKHLGDAVHVADMGGTEITLRVAPPMGVVWTFAMGSIDSDLTWVERLLGLLALPQRMLCTAWYVANRIQRLKALDIPGCAHVIRLAYRKGERIGIEEIADKREGKDLSGTLRQVSLIDGVVFLTSKTLAISLAPRLSEDLDAWSQKTVTAGGREEVFEE